MDKFIEEQLKKCNFVDLSKALYNEAEQTFYIKRYAKPTYALNHCYVVGVANELVNNPTTLLATNWNSGSSPKANRLKIFVSKSMGKMIYVDSIAVDTNGADTGMIWSGWLPIDQLTQISEVTV